VLPQELMIQRVCEICGQDVRLVAALMYGYFTLGQGDQYSDNEFYFFFRDEVLAEVDEEAWVSQIAPVELYLR
jgi:lincosamide nucleotidyltransferase